jgi:guanylate kinase
VFSAPSGSGKTTIVRHLLSQEDLNLEFSISAASRESRGEEANGKIITSFQLKNSNNTSRMTTF